MALAAMTSGALAAPVGVAVEATTVVTGSGPGGNRQIRAESPVFSDDRLLANATGRAQIVLVDETKVIVGPGADVRVDDFVFANERSFEKLTLRATKGAFRFISGASKSTAYKIVTPTGSIGVRGTAFDVDVEDQKVTVAVGEGTVIMCPEDGECKEVGGLCTLAVMDRNKVEDEGDLRSKDDAQKAKFPLMEQEDELNEGFRLPGPGCLIQTASTGGGAGLGAIVVPGLTGAALIGGQVVRNQVTGGGGQPASGEGGNDDDDEGEVGQ